MIKKFLEEANFNKDEWYVVPTAYIGLPYYGGKGYIHFVKKVSRYLRKNYKDDVDALRFIELASSNPTSSYENEFNEMIECLNMLSEEEGQEIVSNEKIKYIGEGAFAKVFLYKEKKSNIKLVIKRLNKNVIKGELIRFKKEYEYMKNIHHPNIVEVYNYDKDTNSYYMEYCDKTLLKYMSLNNNKNFMTFDYRKELVIGLINGIKAIHNKDLLHRDISFNNILVKQYDNNICVLKISDFGIAKNLNLDLTSLDSDRKGTIIDPLLENFKDYNLKNEIYSLGIVINFIFTGKRTLNDNYEELNKIINKCTINKYDERYNNIDELMNDINLLKDYNNLKDVKSDNNFSLNEIQYELLYNASLSDGYICVEYGPSGNYIYAGGKPFDISEVEDEAYFIKYIDDLILMGYLKNDEHDIYKLTYKAYELFKK